MEGVGFRRFGFRFLFLFLYIHNTLPMPTGLPLGRAAKRVFVDVESCREFFSCRWGLFVVVILLLH